MTRRRLAKLCGGLDPLPRKILEYLWNHAVVSGKTHEGHKFVNAHLVIRAKIILAHFIFIRRDDDFDFRDVAPGFGHQLAQRRDFGCRLVRIEFDAEPSVA